MTLADIRSDFEFLDNWEDRYRYVIELGRAIPGLPDALKTDVHKVRGCASQVWLVSRRTPSTTGANTRLHFEGDSDAHIVRGLIAILLTIVDGLTADEIVAIDIRAAFASLGLDEHLTPQRSNGLASMIERVKADARSALRDGAPHN